MPKFDARQTSFDYTMRGHRLRLIKRIVLPAVKGTSASSLKNVLTAIDDHSRDKDSCRLNIATIAQDRGMGQRSVYRALAALEDLGLIDRKYTGRSSRLRINWSCVLDFDPHEQSETTSPMADQPCHRGRPAMPPRQTSHATMADQVCHHGRPTEAQLEAQPPPPPEAHEDTWREAEEAVGAIPEIVKPRTAIAAAKEAGVGPEYVIACVLFFKSLPGAWGPGALVDRLREASPLRAADDPLTWHPPRPPSAREAQALNVLARVRDWCRDHGQTDRASILRTFDSAAVEAEYGAFTPQEIQRAKFDAARQPDFFKERKRGRTPQTELSANE